MVFAVFNRIDFLSLLFQRPPSSSLSYGGHANDDVRSPSSGGTPGPLSQPPSSQALDHSDPGKFIAVLNLFMCSLIGEKLGEFENFEPKAIFEIAYSILRKVKVFGLISNDL